MKAGTSTILVLDGETRSALAVVRALGSVGHNVLVASSSKRTLASSSRYCGESLISPCPYENPAKFNEWVSSVICSRKIDMLIPTKDASVQALSKVEDQIRKYTNYPFISAKTLDAVQDKYELLKVAKSFGILTPESKPIDTAGYFTSHQDRELKKFPLILKPQVSVQEDGNGPQKSLPRAYVASDEELNAFLRPLSDKNYKYLAQEIIPGEGVGVFCLYRNGKSIMDFCHRRILEKPPEGGVSVLSESIPMPAGLLEKVHALLAHFSWEGVAMVEFKRNSDGDFYLMEINPRFWGSLQLAIDSGANFPAALANNNAATAIFSQAYRTGMRLRWELGTLDHAIIQLKMKGLFKFITLLLKNGLQFFKGNTRWEILRANDPRPFSTELIQYFSRKKEG